MGLWDAGGGGSQELVARADGAVACVRGDLGLPLLVVFTGGISPLVDFCPNELALPWALAYPCGSGLAAAWPCVPVLAAGGPFRAGNAGCLAGSPSWLPVPPSRAI